LFNVKPSYVTKRRPIYSSRKFPLILNTFNTKKSKTNRSFFTFEQIFKNYGSTAFSFYDKDEEIKRKLIFEAGLGLSHGPAFGTCGEGFHRMNLTVPCSLVEDACRRLEKTFNN